MAMGKRISIRKVEPGDTLKAVFNKNGKVLKNDVRIRSSNDIKQLKHKGAKYALYPDSTNESSDDSLTETDDASTMISEDPADESIGHLEDVDQNILEKSHSSYQQTLDEMEAVFERVHSESLTGDQLLLFEDHLEDFIKLVNSDPVSLSILTMLEEYDDSTYNHSINVSIFSILFGKYRGFSDSRLLKLAFAALMHDIGKMKIPNSILEKPESLTEDEFETVKEHPITGWEFLDDKLDQPVVPQVALEHHERPDGSGYPFGVPAPGLFSRIVAVVDVYEALTAPRVYKRARDPMRAYNTLRSEFGDNPETSAICNQLIRTLGLIPVGALVRLSNGQCAIVAENNPSEFKRPKIIVITDETGESLESHYYRIDLQHSHHQKYLVNNTIYDDNVEIETVESWEDWSHLKDYALSILEEAWY